MGAGCARRSAWVFRPQPGAAPGRVEDRLRVDTDPGFGDAERRPSADELQRPGGRQRPGPPPGDERVRAAPTGERGEHWPRWLGIAGRPAGAWAPSGPAAVGERQPAPE